MGMMRQSGHSERCTCRACALENFQHGYGASVFSRNVGPGSAGKVWYWVRNADRLDHGPYATQEMADAAQRAHPASCGPECLAPRMCANAERVLAFLRATATVVRWRDAQQRPAELTAEMQAADRHADFAMELLTAIEGSLACLPTGAKAER